MPDHDTVLKVGDTVKLNSDGHLMTVVSIDKDSVTCDWSVRGDIKSKSFPAEALEKAKKEPGTLRELILASMKLDEADDNSEVKSPA
jgi:uncharacterized protein YodC (DUF2158 family)